MYLLTPMDIHNHKFKKGFRGYSENEVDDFLDRIVSDFEKILRENERLKNLINSNDRELEHYRKLEKTLNDTLMVAQRTADEVITSAKKNADEIKENTARECQTILEQARFEADQQISNAAAKRDAVLSEYDKFVREKNAFLMKLRTILESELSITVQMLEDVPSVEETVKKILPSDSAAPVVKSAPDKETAEPVIQPVQIETTPAPAEEIASAEETAPAEDDKPVKKVSEPVVKPAPVKEVPAPAAKPAPKEIPTINDYETNIIDIATKPADDEKSVVTDDTKTYKPLRPIIIDKETSN